MKFTNPITQESVFAYTAKSFAFFLLSRIKTICFQCHKRNANAILAIVEEKW